MRIDIKVRSVLVAGWIGEIGVEVDLTYGRNYGQHGERCLHLQATYSLSRSRYLDRGIVGISIDSSKWEADRHSLLIFLNVCPSH